jgi:D-3-phosphoglycerate dehydrogenase
MVPFHVVIVHIDPGQGCSVPELVLEQLRRSPQQQHDITLEVKRCYDPQWDFGVGQPPLDDDAVVAAATGADVVWIYGGGILSPRAVARLPSSVRAIIRSGSGTDNIATREATQRGILVVNTPRATIHPVADHTIALLFSLTRSIARQAALTQQGIWDRDAAPTPIELEGLTLGLVGFGAIPRSVLVKLQHFGMRFMVFDPKLSAAQIAAITADCVSPVKHEPSLLELCASCDIVSVHAPLIVPDTVGLIGAKELGCMKPTAILINTARGPVVDESALVAALQSNTHGPSLAGLDVVSTEPMATDHPLSRLPNAVVTPHIGGFSDKMFRQFWQLSAESVVAMAAGELPESVVNPCAAEVRTCSDYLLVLLILVACTCSLRNLGCRPCNTTGPEPRAPEPQSLCPEIAAA